MTLKVRILPFLTTFAQLSGRLKNFLRGWLLVLGIKEGLVECATVCVKSVVILRNIYFYMKSIATFALTVFGYYIISVLASVTCDCPSGIMKKCDKFHNFQSLHTDCESFIDLMMLIRIVSIFSRFDRQKLMKDQRLPWFGSNVLRSSCLLWLTSSHFSSF